MQSSISDWAVGGWTKALNEGSEYVIDWLKDTSLEEVITGNLKTSDILFAASNNEKDLIKAFVDNSIPSNNPVAGQPVPFDASGDYTIGEWKGASVAWTGVDEDVPKFNRDGVSPCSS